jgi:hypothetical protein
LQFLFFLPNVLASYKKEHRNRDADGEQKDC